LHNLKDLLPSLLILVEIIRMIDRFPVIKLAGDSTEIGTHHGTVLKERKLESICWYREIFT